MTSAWLDVQGRLLAGWPRGALTEYQRGLLDQAVAGHSDADEAIRDEARATIAPVSSACRAIVEDGRLTCLLGPP